LLAGIIAEAARDGRELHRAARSKAAVDDDASKK
jgi:hypothetical protein